MTVLVLTHLRDDMREMLEPLPARAAALGVALVLVDTDRFPGEIDLETRFEGGRLYGHLEVDGARVDLADVSAVWHRRVAVGAGIPREVRADLRAVSIEESELVLLGTLAALDVFHLDPPDVRRLARTKPLQLEHARRAGLVVPPTITSNDPAAVRDFAARQGDVVFKMLENYTDSARPGRATVFTQRIAEGDLDDAAVALVPVTLQARVEKEVEVRAVVVGQRVYAAAVRSQASERARDDWRRDGVGLIDAWFPWTLPPDVEAALLTLHDRLGLQYGAVDLIVTPDGRHVFLEVNPMGEFFWLEARLGFPILDDLLALLTGRSKRRPVPPVKDVLR